MLYKFELHTQPGRYIGHSAEVAEHWTIALHAEVVSSIAADAKNRPKTLKINLICLDRMILMKFDYCNKYLSVMSI